MSASISGKKILIPIEVQAQAQEVIREMKKTIDDMDSKTSKFQAMGFGALGGAAAGGSQNFLKSAGITGVAESQRSASRLSRKVQSGSGFNESLELAIDQGIEEVIDVELSSGGRLNIKNMLAQAGFDSRNVDQWMSMIKNPSGFFQIMFTRVIPILGGILTAKAIAEFIFTELTARNRPFDLTFRRFINEEFIKLRARELRQQIRVGLRQNIFVSEAGETHPINVVNTLELVRNGQIFELDVYKVRKGYQF